MRNVKTFMLAIVAMVAAFAMPAKAQTAEDIAELFVQTFQEPEFIDDIKANPDFTDFKVWNDGPVINFYFKFADPEVKFADFPEAARQKICDEIPTSFLSGFNDPEVVELVRTMGISFLFSFDDQYGTRLSKEIKF